jgi:hypothetical protein
MADRGQGRSADAGEPEPIRAAEHALRRLGYDRVRAGAPTPPDAAFWVRSIRGSDRLIRVLLAPPAVPLDAGDPHRASILVVPTGVEADAVWARLRSGAPSPPDPDLRILVLRRSGAKGEPYWHEGTVDRAEVLTLATGVLVGMLRQAAGGEEAGAVDFEDMLRVLKSRFHIDVARTLGVQSDEDALWMLYQIAHRFSYAPGDPGPNLHLLVLKPTGPAARLPWFAG